MTYLFFVGLHWPWSWWWQLYLRLSKKNKQTKKPYLRWVVWARCPSSSIATRRCSLFVVVVNIYIYELVKRINKQKKTYLRAQSFDMFKLFGPTCHISYLMSNPSSPTPTFQTYLQPLLQRYFNSTSS